MNVSDKNHYQYISDLMLLSLGYFLHAAVHGVDNEAGFAVSSVHSLNIGDVYF